jgi:hypothetical protein
MAAVLSEGPVYRSWYRKRRGPSGHRRTGVKSTDHSLCVRRPRAFFSRDSGDHVSSPIAFEHRGGQHLYNPPQMREPLIAPAPSPIAEAQEKLASLVGEREEPNLAAEGAHRPTPKPISMEDFSRRLGISGPAPKSLAELADLVGIPVARHELDTEMLAPVGPGLFAKRLDKGGIELYQVVESK